MCRDWLHLCGNYIASYCKLIQYVVLLWSHLKQALTAILPVTENEMPQTCLLRWWGCQHHWLWVLQKFYFKPAWHWLCCISLQFCSLGICDYWMIFLLTRTRMQLFSKVASMLVKQMPMWSDMLILESSFVEGKKQSRMGAEQCAEVMWFNDSIYKQRSIIWHWLSHN